MKKFYAFFKGVMASLVLMSMTFVSCHECDVYDDTDIRNEIANLYELISQLEDRIDNEIETLTTLINGKTVIADATQNADGSWTLLLSTGETITVYPEYQPEQMGSELNEGCITVVQVDGTYYWAIFQNGTAVALEDNAGNKIPVVNNGPIFRVNSDNELEFSLDGETWYPVVEQPSTPPPSTPGGGADCTCIIVDVEDTTDAVIFYLASGDVITVKKALEIDFGVKSGKTFIAPGESADVELIATNIYDLTILTKPEGWKTAINDKVLTITAPEQERIDSGDADMEGVIKIHAAGEDGKCMVGKVAVSASTESLIIEIEGDQITIYNNFTYLTGEPMTLFYGIEARSDFSVDALVKGFNDNASTYGYSFAYLSQINTSTTALYGNIHGSGDPMELPTGDSYIVWAMVQGEGDYFNPYIFKSDDVVYAMYTPAYVDMVVDKVSFDSIEVTIKGDGYASYQTGVVEAQSEEEALMQLESSFGYFQMGWGEMGHVVDVLNYSGPILNFGWGSDSGVVPNSGYVAFVLPIVEGKPTSEYTMDDIKTLFVKSDNIAAGGTTTVTHEIAEIGYDEIRAVVRGSQGTKMIYAKFYEEVELAALTSEQAIIDNLMLYCAEYGQIAYGDNSTVYASSLNPGQEVTLYALAVGNDGKYGALYSTKVSTKELTFNENIKIEIDQTASKTDITSATVKINVTGGEVAKYRYSVVDSASYVWEYTFGNTLEGAESYLALNGESYYVTEIEASSLIDNTILLSDLETNVEYQFVIMGIDAQGVVTRAANWVFKPSLPEYTIIRNSNEKWAATKPTYTLSGVYDQNFQQILFSATITPGAEVEKCWVALASADYMPVNNPAKEGIDNLLLSTSKIWGYGGSVAFTGEFTTEPIGFYTTEAYIHLTWMDKDGNYYQAVQECLYPELVGETDQRWIDSQPTITSTYDLDSNSVSYTVTPGPNTKNMWIEYNESTNYREKDLLTFMYHYNMPGVVQSATEYSSTGVGPQDEWSTPYIGVAWEDNDGNLYVMKQHNVVIK